MNLRLKIELIIGAIIVSMLIAFYVAWKHEKKERKRQETNVSELTKTVDQVNIDLTLTRKEFAEMNTQWADQLDSVIKEHNKKLSQVKEASVITTVYHDTVRVPAKMGIPVPIPKSAKERFKISFQKADSCFSVSGNVETYDKTSTVEITSRGFSNDSWLFVTRKRFLGFLWWKKDTKYEAFGKCGKTEFKHIEFVK